MSKYHYGRTSKNRLNTCHKDIQIILNHAIDLIDITVLEGIRSTERQQELFKAGKSKLDGIKKKSKHQGRLDENGNLVSYAVDIIPYKKGVDPFDPNPKNLARYYYMMGIIKGLAQRLLDEGKINHNVRFGLDWDSDNYFNDQNFDDLPHMELTPVT